jgi:integrase
MRFYFRRVGHKQVPLPGMPGSAEFMAAYQTALTGEPLAIGAGRTKPGSMSALAVSWYGSADFRQLAPASQTTYRRIVERFLAEHGDKPVALLQPKNVRMLIDAKVQTPTVANRLLSILHLLMRHAVERGMRSDDPTLQVRRVRYKVRGFPTWSEDNIAAFEARWPLGSRARLAMSLLLYTGQRRSDVIRMGRQHLRGGAIDVKQQKTGERLTIPLHQDLAAAIDASPSNHLTFLMTEAGQPFASGNAFYNWFTDCVRAAGIPPGLSPHGLRKAAARRLAEAGCTPHQIASITGHTTLKEIERYTKAVDQVQLAKAAIARIGKAPNGT